MDEDWDYTIITSVSDGSWLDARELLSIVETLKAYRNILLGHKIVVHTDHKNLVYKTFNTERVMRWRLLIEEFGPELCYIKGEQNIVANVLS